MTKYSVTTFKEIEARLDLIDRVIKMAEIALQANKDSCDFLYDEMVYGIKCIQHPMLIADIKNDQ